MTNQQAPEIYTLHTVPNKGERPWSGIYTVRADAEHDAKVMRDVTGRDWSVVRLVVADTAATPTGPIARYKIGYATDDWGHAKRGEDALRKASELERVLSDQMRAFADATCALRASHGQAPALTNLNCKSEQKRLATLWGFVPAHADTQPAQQPAPSPAATVGNSGYDYQTAAYLLSGKTVSDETMHKFVAASRLAHDDRSGLRATLLSVRGELASREAEIALLKKALMDAEESRPARTVPAHRQYRKQNH